MADTRTAAVDRLIELLDAITRNQPTREANVLLPDCSLTPLQLGAALRSLGSRYIGATRIYRDYYPPREFNWSRNAYTKNISNDSAAIWTGVLIGEISRLPTPVADDQHVTFVVKQPNWILSGWPEDALADVWMQQIGELRNIIREDRNGSQVYPVSPCTRINALTDIR